jgi:oligoendopeptidase F
MNQQDIAGVLPPVWDNTHIYPSLDSAEFGNAMAGLKADIETLSQACVAFGDPQSAQNGSAELIGELLQNASDAQALLSTLDTFVSSLTSVNSSNEAAHQITAQLSTLEAQLEQAEKPLTLFLLRAPEDVVTTLFLVDKIQPFTYQISHGRKNSDQMLSQDQESMLSGLAVDGLHSWGRLYDKIEGQLRCTIDGKDMGVTDAVNLLMKPEPEVRKGAWLAIQEAWQGQAETSAAVLNALNGWRLEESRWRSHTRDCHYLDTSCHQSHIDRQTLDALMDTAYQRRDIGHRALAVMAKSYQQPQLNPWDVLVPAPVLQCEQQTTIPFAEALGLIADAFSAFDPEMGQFALMMGDKGWIDARPSDNRGGGAYCDEFNVHREPRVFMTYDGNVSNVLTLAHEIGHAWHSWVMRDMHIALCDYPMTLAETASIFAETLVLDALWEKCENDHDRFHIAWEDAHSAATFLNNIPARFEMERSLVEQRKDSELSVSALRSLTADAWAKWYGDTMSAADEYYWASKGHFSISSLGFYNYPYLFGYLFSLGIYAKKDQYGDNFVELYRNILRDTGRMSAEDLIQKHFNEDIRKPKFWLDSMSVVESGVKRFEDLADKILGSSD